MLKQAANSRRVYYQPAPGNGLPGAVFPLVQVNVLIVLESLFPVFILLVVGKLLRLRGLTNEFFLQTVDRLIYYFFFPVMLFWKIGGTSFDAGIDWAFCLACLLTVVTIFVLSTLAIWALRISPFQAGSFSQSCYRFNTYIGVAVVLNSLGVEGLRYFGLAISFSIPVVNFFAVSLLLWFSEKEYEPGKRWTMTIRAIVSNPLILACCAGLTYASLVGNFPVFLDNAFALIGMPALPLALISIGGSLTFSGSRAHLKLSLVASACKLVILPATGYLMFILLGVVGLPFKVGMIFFALPTSTAIYVLSSQMCSDTELASAAIVVSTLFSFASLSLVLLM